MCARCDRVDVNKGGWVGGVQTHGAIEGCEEEEEVRTIRGGLRELEEVRGSLDEKENKRIGPHSINGGKTRIPV